MSLAKALAAQPATSPYKRCHLCALLDDLKVQSPGEHKALLSALDDPRWSHAAIAQVLRAEGHRASDSAVSRHRRQICKGTAA